MTEPISPKSLVHAAGGRLLIDTARFCQLGESLAHDDPLSLYPRLVSELPDDVGECRWRLAGHLVTVADGPQQWFELDLAVRMHLSCDRCLQPVEVGFKEARRFRLVASEEEAARLDEEAEDHDVLVADARFDVRALVEDEAIMMAPSRARHEDCSLPGGRPARDPDDVAPAHPFAGLAALRARRSGEDGDEGGA